MAEPIAIVGLSCRLPGGIKNPEEFWEFLLKKKCGYSEFPPDRFNVGSWHHPEKARPGSMITRGGFLVQHDVDNFDNSFFGLNGVEASSMDSSQKQLLEIAYEALESGNVSLDEIAGSRIGVYVGHMGSDQGLMHKETEHANPYSSTGMAPSILSNRINFTLGLVGPSLTVDTACSSSLYALHLACAGIRNGDCNSALVCAANAIQSIEGQILASKLGTLSPDSLCHAFDESANGYARAEAFCGLYIMRLSDAIESKHPIRAMVRGSAIGANGSGISITRPESVGQASVIRQAYKNAGITDFQNTGYFECHGTGTAVGDPIETHAISTVFAESRPNDRPLLIGSVKSNLGHGEGAAGITAVIKAVLALEHGQIPPTIGLITPNPAIEFDVWRLRVVTETLPWPKNFPVRRTSINSFGFGGANAHVIIEAPNTPEFCTRSGDRKHTADSSCSTWSTSSVNEASDNSSKIEGSRSNSSWDTTDFVAGKQRQADTPKLVLCTAKSEKALDNTIRIIDDLLKTAAAEDVAYTLRQRTQFFHRAVTVVERGEEPVFRKGQNMSHRKLGFVFTGQGAQWPQMGKELLRFPAFLSSVQLIDQALAALPNALNFTVENMFSTDLSQSEIDEPEIAQCMCVALEVALVDLLASWGIKPACVAGHSAGEVAAAYAAGYLTIPEAMAVAFYRGRAVTETAQLPGAMLAVGVSAAEAKPLIPSESNVVIAADNSPRSVTLSGDASAIREIQSRCDQEKTFNRLLATKGRAYHHVEHMKNASKAYDMPLRNMVRSSEPRTAKAQFFSTVTGELWTEHEIPMSYWRRNMESPVLFQQAVSQMRTAEVLVIVEIGPHATLRTPVLDTVKSISQSEVPFTYLSCLRREKDDVKCVLNMVADLTLGGFNIEIEQINGGGTLLRSFPPYQWDHTTKYVTRDRMDEEWRLRKFPRHDLLGSLRPGSALTSPIWRNVLSAKDIPWLSDHKVGSDTIISPTGFLAMAFEAIAQLQQPGDNVIRLENVKIEAPMIVDSYVEVFLAMRKTGSNQWDFEVSSVRDRTSTTHAKGRIGGLRERETIRTQTVAPISSHLNQSVSRDEWYNQILRRKNVYLGTSFRRLSEIFYDSAQHRARAQLNLQTTPNMTGMAHESQYVIHPTVLDNCMQLSVLAAGKTNLQRRYVPASIGRITIFQDEQPGEFATLESTGRCVGFKGLHGGAQLISAETGKLKIELEDVRFIGLTSSLGDEARLKCKKFWYLDWNDDYDAVTKDSESLYFSDESYRPKEYDHYPRPSRARLAQMMIKQFSVLHPELMVSEPVTLENRHFIEWAHWLVQETKREQREIEAMSTEERQNAIESQRPLTPEGYKLTWAIWDNLADIIRGTKSSLDVATRNGALSLFYETQLVYNKFERVVEIMGFKNPHMRILEVGAGTGSATRLMLKSLTKCGTKRYSSLTYTDVSPVFFSTASTEFAEYEDVEYKVFDMDKDLEPQDFEPETYDLVVASCVVHVTENVVKALKSIKKLLRSGGKLLLLEITAEWHDHTLILGTFPGYFKGYAEGRKRHPFLTVQQWSSAFAEAGFSAPELSVNDLEKDHAFTVLTAEVQPAKNITYSPWSQEAAQQHTVSVVCWEKPTAVSIQIEKLAREQGLTVEHWALANGKPWGSSGWSGSSRVIVVAELETALWKDITESTIRKVKDLKVSARTLVWVTQGEPAHGQNTGVSLVSRFLQLSDRHAGQALASMEFEGTATHDQSMAKQILHREQALLRNPKDTQFRQIGGRWLVSRFLPEERLVGDYARSQGFENSTAATSLNELGPVEISTTNPERMTALYFQDNHTFQDPLQADHVEVEVKAVGINMIELDALNGNYDTDTPSSEFAGVVTRVGCNVNDLAIGDRIFAMSMGKFGNMVRLHSNLCQRANTDEHSFAQLATLPWAYSSALYALVNVARIEAGESVLIETASDAFGLAAIAIARMNGADVFTTESSLDKRAYLGQLGLHSDHIFCSKDVTAIGQMLKATNERGFDVVLSTSDGEYLRSVSWPAVASFGRFVHLGPGDTFDDRRYGLSTSSRSVRFTALDVRVSCEKRPQMHARLMRKVGELYQEKRISPLQVTPFPLSSIVEAYQHVSQRAHIGKVVLLYQDDDKIPYMPTLSKTQLDHDSAYLVIGGLTDVGGPASLAMAKHGAGTIIFLDSDPVAREAQQTIDQIRAVGATVILVPGRSGSREDVRRALTITRLPIRGILHSSIGSREVPSGELSIEHMQHLLQKFEGNVNLHEISAGLGHRLDFFIMLDSIPALSRAEIRSSDFVASSSFNDFAIWRRKQGLEATSIGLDFDGVISNEDMEQSLGNRGERTIDRDEMLGLFETILLSEDMPACLCIGRGPSNAVPKADAMSLWEHNGRRTVAESRASKKGTRVEVNSGRDNSSKDNSGKYNSDKDNSGRDKSGASGCIKDLIIDRLASLLWMPAENIKLDSSLANLGVDSMLINEFRNWINQTFKETIGVTELLAKDMTVKKLAEAIEGQN